MVRATRAVASSSLQDAATTKPTARPLASTFNHPETADRVKIAVNIACEYWTKRHLNVLADKDDLHGITRRVNGLAMKGLATRAL